MNGEILDRVLRIVAEQHNMDVKDLTPDTHFVDDLGDSLNVVETVMASEEEFDIVIPDEAAEELGTARQVAAFVEQELKRLNRL